MDRERPVTERGGVGLQIQLQILPAPKRVHHHQAIGEYRLQGKHPKYSDHQHGLIDLDPGYPPGERQKPPGMVVKQTILTKPELLEVLRRQQHSLVPLDRVWDLRKLVHRGVNIIKNF